MSAISEQRTGLFGQVSLQEAPGWIISVAVHVVIMAILLAPFLRKFGAFTLASYLGRRFQSRTLRVLAAGVLAVPTLLMLAAELRMGAYAASKAAVAHLGRNLAREWVRSGVNVNVIQPGYIRTELNVPLQQDRKFCAMLEQRTAAHRWGTPADLRGALLLLASDASAYITGHTLVVDGGMTTILA